MHKHSLLDLISLREIQTTADRLKAHVTETTGNPILQCRVQDQCLRIHKVKPADNPSRVQEISCRRLFFGLTESASEAHFPLPLEWSRAVEALMMQALKRRRNVADVALLMVEMSARLANLVGARSAADVEFCALDLEDERDEMIRFGYDVWFVRMSIWWKAIRSVAELAFSEIKWWLLQVAVVAELRRRIQGK